MIEPKTLFIEKRVSDTIRVLPGAGSLTVNIPFIPEYIKAKFLGQIRKRATDIIAYDLIYTGNPDVPYQIVINWNIASGQARKIRYTVAKLASFHNGVN